MRLKSQHSTSFLARFTPNEITFELRFTKAMSIDFIQVSHVRAVSDEGHVMALACVVHKYLLGPSVCRGQRGEGRARHCIAYGERSLYFSSI